ncbi:MAG: hypothetical protein K6F99_07330 [Lachnospiraceae bacterium]|nr:hypothetical protein [Lachnospiraceae bacterium]
MDQESKLASTGYGRATVEACKMIYDIANADLSIIHEAMASNDPRPFISIIQEGRSGSATVEANETINTVGGQMNQRIPLSIQNPNGNVEEGFFTPEKTFKGYDSFRKDHLNDAKKAFPNKNSPQRKIAQALCDLDYKSMFKILLSETHDDQVVNHIDYLKNPLNKQEFKTNAGSLEYFNSYYEPLIEKLPQDIRNRMNNATSEEGKELREYFMNTLITLKDNCIDHYMYQQKNKIPVNSNIDKRNTAMSMVADYLGLGKLIAGSRSFEVTIKGKTQKGTFMKKAEGEDFNTVADGDDLAKIAKEREEDPEKAAIDTPELKRQLSDLMVIDYICGNYDRYQKNMLYKTAKDANGKVQIVGITGIDNDLSFGGKVNENKESQANRLVSPSRMRLMRYSTATKILDFKPEKLQFILADMNLSEPEIKAAKERLNNLKKQISTDMKLQNEHPNDKKVSDDHILIIQDAEFENYPIKDLVRNPGDEKTKQDNYFDIVAHMEKDLYKQRNILPGIKKDFKYAKAVVDRPAIRFQDAKENPKTVNINEVEQKIKDANAILKNCWKLFVYSSGEYRWMEQSVNKLTTRFNELKQKYDPPKISGRDADELESLFRQINRSGKLYAETHKKNPSTSSGKARVQLANMIKDLKIDYKEAPVVQNNNNRTNNNSQRRQMNLNQLNVQINGNNNTNNRNSHQRRSVNNRSRQNEGPIITA